MTLTGKTLIVTGGDRGIGASIVEGCANQGATVHFTYNSARGLAEELVSRLSSSGGAVECHQLDVTDEAAVASLAHELGKRGGVDMLVNNAGIVADGFFLMAKLEKWMKVIEVDLLGAIRVTRHFAPQLAAKRSGSIVNIASVGGVIGIPGQTNYTAAKGGLIAFTKSLSKEMARFTVTVNAVAPGYVETDMVLGYSEDVRAQFLERVPMKRFAKPREIAALVSFLGSEDARYITGQVIVVDGGLT